MSKIETLDPVWEIRRDTPFLIVLIFLAVVIRAPGLGRWCLGSDEFYLSQSVHFILAKGIPEFPSGGYYVRGIGLQYLTALIGMVVEERELQIRILPFLFGVLTVPIFYRLCRLFLPPLPSFFAGLILVLSSWHIEFSRFGRFYAPFQFCFVFFVYFFYRGYWLDSRSSRIASWTVAFLSVLVFEGAVFMPVLLLLALTSPSAASKRRFTILFLAGLLLLVNYLVNGGGYRNLGVGEESLQSTPSSVRQGEGRTLPVALPPMDLFRSVLHTPMLVAGYSLLGIVALWILYLQFKRGPTGLDSAIGSVAVLLPMLHQYGLLILLLAFTALFRREFFRRGKEEAISWLLFLSFSLGFWSIVLWNTGMLDKIMGYLVGYPPIKYAVILPFAKTVPLWGALACTGLFLSFVRNMTHKSVSSSYLLGLTLLCIVLVSFFTTPYRLTRYTFFLLPLVILLPHIDMYDGIRRLSGWATGRMSPRAVQSLIMIPMAAYLASDDFHIRHVLDVSAPAFNFRLSKYRKFEDHWYPRRDFRNPSLFVNRQYKEGDRIVIDAIACSVYLEHPYIFYSDTRSPWFQPYSRKGGTKEIWTGSTMLSSGTGIFDAIVPEVPQNPARRLWFITAQRLKAEEDSASDSSFLVNGVLVTRKFTGRDERFHVYEMKRTRK